MFITDLDGTLFTDNKHINNLDLKALKKLGEMGVVRVFATGRSIYSFEQAVEKIDFSAFGEKIPVDYIICSTGACIIECSGVDFMKSKKYDQNSIKPVKFGNVIKKHSLKSEDVIYIADYFDSLELDYMIYKPVPDSHYCIYRQQRKSLNKDFRLRIDMYKDFIKPINYSGDIKYFGCATEFLTIVPSECGHKIADMIEQALSEFSVVRATSPLDGESLWIEVFNKSVSKSQAVSWLADELNIKQQDTAAIGNDYNDLDMLKWVNHGFIVKNAHNSIKEESADNADKKKFTEVASNNESGVSEAIDIFLYQKKFF